MDRAPASGAGCDSSILSRRTLKIELNLSDFLVLSLLSRDIVRVRNFLPSASVYVSPTSGYLRGVEAMSFGES